MPLYFYKMAVHWYFCFVVTTANNTYIVNILQFHRNVAQDKECFNCMSL